MEVHLVRLEEHTVDVEAEGAFSSIRCLCVPIDPRRLLKLVVVQPLEVVVLRRPSLVVLLEEVDLVVVLVELLVVLDLWNLMKQTVDFANTRQSLLDSL